LLLRAQRFAFESSIRKLKGTRHHLQYFNTSGQQGITFNISIHRNTLQQAAKHRGHART